MSYGNNPGQGGYNPSPPPPQGGYNPPQHPQPSYQEGGQEKFYNSGQFNPNDPRMQDPRNQPYQGNMNTPRTNIARVPREKVFDIDYYSEEDGFRYQGSFTVRKPTFGDRSTIGVMKARYLDGSYHDPDFPGKGVPMHVDRFAEIRAFLDNQLIKYPEWWEGAGDCTDADLVFEIFMEASEIDPFFRSERRTDDRSTSTPDRKASNPEPDKTLNHGDAADMVDEPL